jgi:hypothetical protein
MQALSDRQLKEVSRIIDDHHSAFLVQIGLGDTLPEEQVTRLLKTGLITKAQVKRGLIEGAFLFGFLADSMEELKLKDMSYSDFKHFITQKSVPLSAEETMAIKHLKRSVATHLKGLGGRIDQSTQEVLVDADQDLRRRLAAVVKRELVQGIEKRKSLNEVVGALRKATNDHAHNWHRIVVTEVNNAFQEGKLATIQKSNKGRDPWVFKRVRKGACEECKSAYLTKSGTPRVFKLSELLATGTNVNRVRADRQPTVKSHHPWCQCELQEMPPGFKFDRSGKLVYEGLGS